MDIVSDNSLSQDRSAAVDAPLAVRSGRVRKPTPALLAVKGVNGQSIPARRFREIATALADDCGGPDKLSAPTIAKIRQAASMTVKLEDMTAKTVAGEDVDLEQLTRLSNVLSRALRDLGMKKRAIAALPRPWEIGPGG